jgi:hypothetical protein
MAVQMRNNPRMLFHLGTLAPQDFSFTISPCALTFVTAAILLWVPFVHCFSHQIGNVFLSFPSMSQQKCTICTKSTKPYLFIYYDRTENTWKWNNRWWYSLTNWTIRGRQKTYQIPILDKELKPACSSFKLAVCFVPCGRMGRGNSKWSSLCSEQPKKSRF